MPVNCSTRRGVLLSASLAATGLFNLRDAIAAMDGSDGDWLAMVKAHHKLVAKTFEQMLDSGSRTFLKRDAMQHALSYQLTAHSVAEENVLYPALARMGLLTESDRLYLDQGHAKVQNAELALVSEKDESAWFDKVRTLQAAVLKHALQDEEADIYPRLLQKTDKATNVMLATAYKRHFESVKPVRSTMDMGKPG